MQGGGRPPFVDVFEWGEPWVGGFVIVPGEQVGKCGVGGDEGWFGVGGTFGVGEPDEEWVDVGGVAGDAGLCAGQRGCAGAAEWVEDEGVAREFGDEGANEVQRVGGGEAQPSVTTVCLVGAVGEAFIAGGWFACVD